MEKKVRKCAYARVSTAAEEQEHSLMAQAQYYREMIESDTTAIFVGIYADKKSGKNIRQRPQFLEMINACNRGEIDYIVTKSISRFARNLVDTLRIIRKLREMGIGVYFEKENIDTLQSSSDFMLSIYSTVAEAELTSMGDNVRWAARKRYASGSVELASNLYGYTLNEKGDLEILPEEAEIVKDIFTRYLNGDGHYKIADALNKRGVRKKLTDTLWGTVDILRIITNEKYAGDALLQKYYIENNRHIKNKGEVPQYYVENNHEGIITREQFEQAQLIHESRVNQFAAKKPRQDNPFTSKIICMACGKKYIHRTNNRHTPYEKRIWSCSTYVHNGRNYCKGFNIREKDLTEIFLSAYNEAVSFKKADGLIDEMHAEFRELLACERETRALKARGYISDEMYEQEHGALLKEISERERRYENEISRQACRMPKKKESSYSDGLVEYLDCAYIDGHTVTFMFKNGANISKTFKSEANRKLTWQKKKEEVLHGKNST